MTQSTIFPNGKRAAALVTVNLDAEQFWLGMFEGAEKRPKTLSMGDYGINRGLDRVLKTLDEYQIRATFFVPGMVIRNHPQSVELIAKHGHEIALHGHTHTPMHLLTGEAQSEEMALSLRAAQDVLGILPIGFRAPEGELSRDTLVRAERAGFLYSSSLYDDDRPYVHDGMRLTEIPMNWNTHDFPYFAFNYGPAFPIAQSRVSSYARVCENYLEEFDAYRTAGLCYVAQFTPQSIGSPGKIVLLERVLERIAESSTDVWSGTCEALVNFLHEN